MDHRFATAAAAIALLASTAAFAREIPPTQKSTTMPPGAATQLGPNDQKFVEDAAIGGTFEVKAGQLAEKSAANPKVRQFGARMVRDHGKADAQLKQVAAATGATLPQQLDQQHQQLLDRLASLKGPEFDRAYMKEMVQDHDTDTQAFGKSADELGNPRLKRFAQQTRPVIEQHDRMAHQIADKMAAQ